MKIESLNLYLDGLLGLCSDPESNRAPLIEEAAATADICELLQDWLWLLDLDEKSCLQIRVWFGLSYRQLGKVLHLSSREVAQLIKSQRAQMLSTYPAISLATSKVQEDEKIAGLSCFMVEQHLSAWSDSELIDPKIQESIQTHLRACALCTQRLQEYRQLQADILKKRPSFEAVTEKESQKVLKIASRRKRDRILRFAYWIFIILTVLTFLAWVIWSKPEKMPNIYEIP
ncbi:MAG: hypothetical protein J0L93_06240 [Deltaproteobacteria bacterium]|nr:hypothetical protein [Deltaproteobacteria bacterium]